MRSPPEPAAASSTGPPRSSSNSSASAVRASYIVAGDTFQRGNDPAQQAPEPIRENITAEYRLTHTVKVSAGHQNYLVSTLSSTHQFTPAAHSTLDSASIQYVRCGTAIHLTLLHSRAQLPETPTEAAYTGHNYALTADLNQTLGRFQLDENLLHSIQSGSGGSTLFISGAGITVNSHLRLTEGLNITSSGVSFSHGGAFVTRFSSFEVGYQILYLADRPANPFEQATVFDAQLRLLRDFWLRAASSISPTGATLYTFNLGTQFDHQPGIAHVQPVVGLGGNLLRGHVVDTTGKPVEGAAVQVGPDHLYTDSLGFFSYREKNSRLHPFLVLTDEFIEFGKFILVSAPPEVKTTAAPDAPLVTVIVARGRFPAPGIEVASAKPPQLTADAHDPRSIPHPQPISARNPCISASTSAANPSKPPASTPGPSSSAPRPFRAYSLLLYLGANEKLLSPRPERTAVEVLPKAPATHCALALAVARSWKPSDLRKPVSF